MMQSSLLHLGVSVAHWKWARNIKRPSDIQEGIFDAQLDFVLSPWDLGDLNYRHRGGMGRVEGTFTKIHIWLVGCLFLKLTRKIFANLFAGEKFRARVLGRCWVFCPRTYGLLFQLLRRSSTKGTRRRCESRDIKLCTISFSGRCAAAASRHVGIFSTWRTPSTRIMACQNANYAKRPVYSIIGPMGRHNGVLWRWIKDLGMQCRPCRVFIPPDVWEWIVHSRGSV
jgi:hypothetical protein